MSVEEKQVSNKTNDRAERNNYVPGFEPVLLRSESKKRLKEFRFAQIGVPRDMHIERHLVTAAIDLVLADEDTQRRWLEYVRQSLRTDIDQIDQMAGNGLAVQPG